VSEPPEIVKLYDKVSPLASDPVADRTGVVVDTTAPTPGTRPDTVGAASFGVNDHTTELDVAYPSETCARQYTFLFHNNPGNVTGTEAADNHPVSTQGLGKVGSWGVDLRKRG